MNDRIEKMIAPDNEAGRGNRPGSGYIPGGGPVPSPGGSYLSSGDKLLSELKKQPKANKRVFRLEGFYNELDDLEEFLNDEAYAYYEASTDASQVLPPDRHWTDTGCIFCIRSSKPHKGMILIHAEPSTHHYGTYRILAGYTHSTLSDRFLQLLEGIGAEFGMQMQNFQRPTQQRIPMQVELVERAIDVPASQEVENTTQIGPKLDTLKRQEVQSLSGISKPERRRPTKKPGARRKPENVWLLEKLRADSSDPAQYKDEWYSMREKRVGYDAMNVFEDKDDLFRKAVIRCEEWLSKEVSAPNTE